jgi:hypothetical protein
MTSRKKRKEGDDDDIEAEREDDLFIRSVKKVSHLANTL